MTAEYGAWPDCSNCRERHVREGHRAAARPSGDIDAPMSSPAYSRALVERHNAAARPSGEVDACTRTHAPGSTHYHVLRPRAALDGRRA